VGATVVIGAALAAEERPGALLAALGAGTLPGLWAAKAITARGGAAHAAAAGLALQAGALALIALALSAGTAAVWLAAILAGLGAGHVAANAGVAGALPAGGVAYGRAVANGGVASGPAVAALLVAAQYVGSGAGALGLDAIARHGVSAAVLAGALMAAAGALTVLGGGRRAGVARSSGASRTTDPRLPDLARQ
jgi:hypothetical protein